jgi:hypothetical protein
MRRLVALFSVQSGKQDRKKSKLREAHAELMEALKHKFLYIEWIQVQ